MRLYHGTTFKRAAQIVANGFKSAQGFRPERDDGTTVDYSGNWLASNADYYERPAFVVVDLPEDLLADQWDDGVQWYIETDRLNQFRDTFRLKLMDEG